MARQLLAVALGVLLFAPGAAAQRPHRHRQVQKRTARKQPAPIDQRAIQVQVMLDRAGFSPGEIDGTMNASATRALEAYTKAGGSADALPADALTHYRITDQDAAGPFTPRIPHDMMQQAALDALSYRDIVEELGEKFHVNPGLLRRLNPQAHLAAGEDIVVPNVLQAVQPVGPPARRQSDISNAANVTVTVRKSTSDLTATDAAGHVLLYAPVTTGSEHDPLPIGEWKVNGVQHHPKFHYNPDLFWDAKPGDSKTTIQPGPNNPVGVVWIDLSKPNYGIHGTPEPSLIGKTTSHGCVRLTNWDATKLASLVRPGTRVVFSE